MISSVREKKMDRLFRTLTYDYTKHEFFFEKDVDALISEVVKFLERHQSF